MNVNFIHKIHRACFYHRLIDRGFSQKNGRCPFFDFFKACPKKEYGEGGHRVVPNGMSPYCGWEAGIRTPIP